MIGGSNPGLVASEAEIQDSILEYLAMRRHFCWRQGASPVPIRKGKELVGLRPAARKGVADILGCTTRQITTNTARIYARGTFFAIEVKSRTGSPSKDQREFLEGVKNAGGIGFIARSLDDVMVAGL